MSVNIAKIGTDLILDFLLERVRFELLNFFQIFHKLNVFHLNLIFRLFCLSN